MGNTSKFAAIGENWNFVPSSNNLRYFYTTTKEELLVVLNKQINKEHVILNQHFGIRTELNLT